MITHYIKLIRWPNLLMMILIMVLVRYFLIAIPLTQAGVGLVNSPWLFGLLMLSVVLLAAAGYVINDYFDQDVDEFNKPHKQIVGKHIPAESAKRFYWQLTITGMLAGFYVSYAVSSLRLALIFIMLAGLLWFYSSRYKRMVLVGNIVVAFVAATGVFVVWFFELNTLINQAQLFIDASRLMPTITGLVFAYALFASISSILRELIKDIEDQQGDQRCGCRTFPVVYGISVAKNLALGLAVILLSMIGFWQYILYFREMHTAMGVLFVSDAIGLIVIARLFTATSKTHFRQAATFVKLLMLTGILSIPFLFI